MAEASPPAGKSGFLRPVPIALACLPAAILLACIGAWIFRVPLAEWAIPAVAERNGIASLTLKVESLDLGGMAATDIAIGPGGAQHIDRIEADFSLDGLRKGEIAGILVRGVRLQGNKAGDGLTLPGLEALLEGGSDEAAPIRVVNLSLEDARIALTTPFGDVHASIQANARTEPGGLVDATGRFAIESESTDIDASARGSFSATLIPSGEILGRIAIEDGALHTPRAAADGLSGTVQVVGTDNGIATDMTLYARHAHIDNQPLSDGRLTAGLNIGTNGTTVDVRLDAGEGSASLTGQITPDAGDGLTYDGGLSLRLELPTVAARLAGTLHAAAGADGGLEGTVDIANAALSLHEFGIEADGIAGRATFDRSDAMIPDATATLTIQTLTLPGVPAGHGRFAFSHKAGQMESSGEISSESGGIAFQANLPSGQPLDFTATGSLAPGSILTAVVDGARMDGTVAFDLSGTLDDPMDGTGSPLDRLTLTGTVRPELAAIGVAGFMRDGALRGQVEVQARSGEWVFSSPAVRLSGLRLAPEILASLPERLRRYARQPIQIGLEAMDDTDAVLRLVPNGATQSATLSGTVKVASGNVELAASGQARARLPATVIEASGRFRLAGTHTERLGENAPSVTLRPDLTGIFRFLDDVLTLETDATGKVRVDGLDLPGGLHTDAPLLLNVDRPFNLRVGLGGDPVSVTYSGGATLRQFRLATDTTELVLSDLPFRLAGTGGALNGRIGPLAVDIPGYAVGVRGITASIAVDDTIELDATITEIHHEAQPAAVVPLRLSANAVLRNEQAAFTARLHDDTGTISIRASGDHDLASGAGSATIESDAITFLPTVLQPRQLFPVVGNHVEELNGDLDGKANFRWSKGALTSSGEISANVALLKMKGFAMENAATIVTFDNLLPPSTPPGQEILVGLLDIGIPLSKGRIEFRLDRDGGGTAALRELDMFGGRIETETFTIPARLEGVRIPLVVNGVRLDALLAATKVGDLTATGTLNGLIPVVFEAGSFVVRDGFLESATGGGTIQYRPKEVGPALAEANEGTALFLDIVHDFHYDSIRVTIDEQPDGTVPFEFKIKGRNLTVYNGAPVELNLTMSGPLRAILQQGLKTYTLPDRLLERMYDLRTP